MKSFSLLLSENLVALGLASVLVPEEFNLVIKPSHKDFSMIIKTAKVLLGKRIAPVRLA